MNFAQFTLQEQGVVILAALVLFASFSLLAQTRIIASIHAFAWQGALVAAATALVAFVAGQPHLYLSALITLALKAMLIPWILHRIVVKLAITREVETVVNPALVLLAAAALVAFSYYVALPVEKLSTLATRNTIAISMAVVLLGMLIMVTRRQAITQVVGFMSMENGLFFAAVVSTHGMPMVVELGVAFDLLVATVIFGVFFFQIRQSIESLDVDRLSRLAESTELDEAVEPEEPRE
ncbi:MAG: formate hydrogenlyase [Gammaproteobacteria bacterium HGW-Gammaproteobacteria-1]|jgi:hydrogenase-4 component E|nr:MAG: formate hydrogenlyase [Gammaproteobacteria bacterium HGW-Gammaproteobacteria-1]